MLLEGGWRSLLEAGYRGQIKFTWSLEISFIHSHDQRSYQICSTWYMIFLRKKNQDGEENSTIKKIIFQFETTYTSF